MSATGSEAEHPEASDGPLCGAVPAAADLNSALRAAQDLSAETSAGVGELVAALDGRDQVLAAGAAFALGRSARPDAHVAATALLDDPSGNLARYVLEGLAEAPFLAAALPAILGWVRRGAFEGALAQRVFRAWRDDAGVIVPRLEAELGHALRPEERLRLVELLGAFPASSAHALLQRIADDDGDHPAVRQEAREALLDERAADRAANGEPPARSAVAWTVIQPIWMAHVDPLLSGAGAGGVGGIATLLVQVGDALAARDAAPSMDLLTLSVGSTAGLEASVGRHAYRTVSFGPLRHGPEAGHLVIAREMRRLIQATPGKVVLHLRMADMGNLTTAEVLGDLGVPYVFTLAPDPHAVIETLERSGTLTRQNFLEVDKAQHFWFRSRVVDRLVRGAAQLAVFPRADVRSDLARLVGIDLDNPPHPVTVLPEGIDLAAADRAVADATAYCRGGTPEAGLEELETVLDALPTERRGLPVLVTVGRLHPVKGVPTLVRAWHDSALHDRANLLVVGGDLDHPSAVERDQLSQIDSLLPSADWAREGLLVAGHRPHAVALRWIAAARIGPPSRDGRGGSAPGAYVCASVKEEFGMALLEALACGAIVVGPDAGGPPTYIENGSTGFLTDTTDTDQLAGAIENALVLAAAERGDERVARARKLIDRNYSIQRVAETLTTVYAAALDQQSAAADTADAQQGLPDRRPR